MAENNLWFKEAKRSPPCTDEQIKELGKLLLHCLENPSQPFSTVNPHLTEPSPRIIFLSVSQNLETAKVYLGIGNSFIEAFKDVYEKLRILPLNPKATIKLDVVTRIKNLGPIQQNQKIKLEYTIEGIAFSRKAHFAILPEQIFCNRIYDEKSNLINYQNVYDVLDFDPLASTQLARILKNKNIRLFTFKTKSILISEKSIRPLFRGKLITTTLSQEDIQARLEKAAFYLTRAVNRNGKFNYIFKPDTRYYPWEYNVTRHAGTTYAMFEYCEAFPNEKVLTAAKKAFKFLYQQMVEGDIPSSVYVLERGIVKLGANALAAIALEKYIKATKDKQYLSLLIKLGNGILGKIQQDGQFKPQKEFYLKNIHQKDTQSAYFPGEAILALLRIYSNDNNIKWLEGAEKAANWLINVRDKVIPDSYHDHWLLYALNELYFYQPKKMYLDHAKKICRSSFTTQIENGRYPDWDGGYGKKPRSTPTATRGEGLYAIYCLFKRYGKDKAFLNTILDTYRKLIIFELSTQFLENSVIYFSNPSDSLGAFHGSPTIPEIRIDYVQHNMSSILGYYKLLFEKIN